MKRSCKDVNIEDVNTIKPWVAECLKRHKKRYDFQKLLKRTGGLTDDELCKVLSGDNTPLDKASTNVAREAVKRINDRQLDLSPCSIREQQDKSTLKMRLIGKESAMQQVFDYIAVRSCEDIWRRRFVHEQASSIKGRGQVYGTALIGKWIGKDYSAIQYAKRHKQRYSPVCKYYAKLDVQKCYQSMRSDVFMKFFKRDCGNDTILWLWQELLESHKVQLADGTTYEGFMIGALPSQMASQYLLSYLYRYAKSKHYTRRGRTYKSVSHMLLFMDDMLLTGKSRKELKRVVDDLILYADRQLGLTIKPNWHIHKITRSPVDMMGYVTHRDSNVTIRARVFVRMRRLTLRIKCRGVSHRQAKRLVSYKGYIQQSHVRLKAWFANKKYKIIKTLTTARRIISLATKEGSKVHVYSRVQ